METIKKIRKWQSIVSAEIALIVVCNEYYENIEILL